MAYYARRRVYRRRAPVRRRRSYAYAPRTRRVARRAPVRRRARTVSSSTTGEPTVGRSGSKYILAQANPFDENADGVKIPDANSQPSVALKAEDAFTISTGASQTLAAAAFNPSTSKMLVSATYATASTWTWSASFGGATSSSKNSKMISDMELARPVAHAIRITCGLAPTTTTGFLHVAVYTQALYQQSSWTYPASIADLSNVPGYKRIPLARLTAEGLTIINRPLDCTSQRYVDTDDPAYANGETGEFSVPFQWGCIVVAVEGAPASSSVLAVESILHLECIPRATSISTASNAASYSPAALGAASNSMAKTPSTFLDQDKGERTRQSIVNARRGLDKVTGRAQSMRSAFEGYSSRRGRYAENWQKAERPKGIPGVNDRSLAGVGKADVEM